jgi:RHS repeat-associated protein
MYVANTHLKPVIGIDIHFVNLPFPFVPIPHPYIGLVFDPFDYIPFIGATVKVNGVPRGNTDTMGMIITFVHIPLGAGFTLYPIIGHNSQNFFGSKKVMVDGAPMSGAGYMLMTCNDIGIPLNFRPGEKFIPIPSLYLPTSFCIPLQWGKPVHVGGPLVPHFSLMALLKAFVFGCFLKVLGKIAAKLMKKLSNKLASKLGASSKLKAALCKMGFEPVDLITGRVNYEYADFSLPGPIPLQWTRIWDSDAGFEGPLGHGTHFCYDRYIRLFEAEEAMALLLDDGRVAAFPWLQPGQQAYNRQEKLLLHRKPNGHFLLEDFGASLYFHFNHSISSDTVRLSFIEDFNGHRIRFHYDRTLLTAITDSAGRQLLLHYDEDRHVAKVDLRHRDLLQTLVTYTYNAEGDLVAIKDAMGQTTRLEYNDHLMVKKTDRNGQIFYWEYDQKRRCVHTWGEDGVQEGWIAFNEGYTVVTNAVGEHTTYRFDEDNLCIQQTDHYGNHRYTEYTDDGNIHREIDELGNVTGYVYNEHGWLQEKIAPDHTGIQLYYTDHHQVKLVIYPDGSSETYGYDRERRLRFINYPNGKTTGFEYNEKGQLAAMVQNGKKKTVLYYDEDENLVKLERPRDSAQWKYDEWGRCVQATNPEGQIRHYEYDALGRLRNMYLPDGNRIKLDYKAYSEVAEVTDRNNRVEYQYTPMGSLSCRRQGDREVKYLYDRVERLRAVVNESGHYYRFEYNKRGEIVRETGFDGIERKYERNVAGKIMRVDRPGGRYALYEYDANGRIIRTELEDGGWELFRYDANGNIREAVNEHTTIQFDRGKSGLVEKEWQDHYFVGSRYDKYGNRTAIDSSLGAGITIQRDETGLPAALQAAQWNCRLYYNSAGQEIRRDLPGGIKSEREYDHAGRPGAQKVSRNEVLQSWKKYTWEAGDRLTGIFDVITQSMTSFKQDAWGNLVFAQYADSSMIYRAADDAGNFYETKDKTDRKYDTAGALTDSRSHVYAYDQEGNQISKTEKSTGRKWQYQWQGNGMLNKVIRPDGKAVCFKYDALGRRIEKTFNGVVTRFLWDGNTILHEWTYEESERPKPVVTEEGELRHMDQQAEPAEAVTTWVFDADGFSPAAKLKDGKAQSIICDYLGTPQAMYDNEGKKSWEGVLDIYGRVRSLTGARDAVPFRYKGQYEDVETGLYYNRFRYYSPEEGMYISQDPIRLRAGTRMYGYVSDPNYWTDLLGLDPIFDEGLADKARSVHNLAGNDQLVPDGGVDRAISSRTVAIGEGTFPDGHTELFASGNGASLRPVQRNALIDMGVPAENIYSGKAFKQEIDGNHEATLLANHAERVVIRNAPEGVVFKKWGISWGGQQRNASCANCKPHVDLASECKI